MNNLGASSHSSGSKWDDPLLQTYVEREANLCEETDSDEDELAAEIVKIWRLALANHPQLVGSYLRLASAHRDCGDHHEAAAVLRQGIENGQSSLLADLLVDYPDLVTPEEMHQAQATPQLARFSFLAAVSQKRIDDALSSWRVLIQQPAQADQAHGYLLRASSKLVELLMLNNRWDDAHHIHAYLAKQLAAEPSFAPLSPITDELLEPQEWLLPPHRHALAQLTLTDDASALRESLAQLSQVQRDQFFADLRQHCPLVYSQFKPLFLSIAVASAPSSDVTRLAAMLTLVAVTAATIWYIC